jgi:type II secretory pathway component GspD/PulD (secretin)
MTRVTRILSAALLAGLLAAPAIAQDPLSKRVTLDLKAVEPSAAFDTIAAAVGLKVVIDPSVTAPVDIVVHNVRASTALDAMCDSIGCRWSVAKGTLSIAPATPPGTSSASIAVRRSPAETQGRAKVDRETVEFVQGALKRQLPAGLVFENTPLAEVGARLSTALGLDVTIASDDPKVRTVTADLGGCTLQTALGVLTKQGGGGSTWTITLRKGGEKDPTAFGLRIVSRAPKKK